MSQSTPSPSAAHAGANLFTLPAGVTYLDTAAHGPRLRTVQAAAQAALDAAVAPWRQWSDGWEASIESVRAGAAGLFDHDPEAVALVPSAAHGLAIAAHNLPLAAGDAVLVLDGQFPSNLLPWQQRCAQVGARVVVARRNGVATDDSRAGADPSHCSEPAAGHGWTDAVLAALDADPSIRVLALPQAYWHDGALLDLDRIAARARAAGAALVLDLSQSLGALPVDIAAWQPDFVVAVGHKWALGAHGVAYLWASPHWRDHGASIEQHWLARDVGGSWRFPADHPAPYRAGARRFDAGGVAEPQRLAMANAALQQINAWGVAAIAAQLRERTAALASALADLQLSHWLTPPPYAHFVGLRPPTADTLRAVVAALAAADVVATSRHGVVRIAPYLHVGVQDMGKVAAVIGAAARRSGKAGR